jgi:phosphoribosyl-ATP pyrophosphohydrolase
VELPVREEDEVSMNNQGVFSLRELYQVIVERKKQPPSVPSRTRTFLAKREEGICQKLIEEAEELVVASRDANRGQIVHELCDLLYFALVLAVYHDIELTDIEEELLARHLARDSETSKAIDLSALEDYRHAWPFTFTDMCSKCGLTSGEAQELITLSDIVLFSHNFRKPTLSGVRVINAFPRVAAELKNALETTQYKLRFGLSGDAVPTFRASRTGAQEWIAPILVVINLAVLPICLDILAAYLKDAIDAHSGRKQSIAGGVELDICVRETPLGKESWYRIRGEGNKIVAVLESLRDSLEK